MATTVKERKQHLQVGSSRSDGQEIPAPDDSLSPQDFDGKMQEVRQQLEYLHAQKLEAERKRLEDEAREHRRADFINGQIELTEKFASAITTIEHEVKEAKREIEELEATRKSFKAHLQRIETINSDSWAPEKVDQLLDQSVSILDQADDEFDQAAAYFAGGRRAGSAFHGSGRTSRLSDDFRSNLLNGLAFNLPILGLGLLALLVILAK